MIFVSGLRGVFVAFLVTVLCGRAAETPRVFTLEPALLLSARERAARGDPSLRPALDALRHQASAALAAPLAHVAQKPREVWAASGDPRDYVSSPRFAWPDPAKPEEGGAWIIIDGKPNTESAKLFDGPRIAAMQRHVATLSLAWWFLRDRACAERAVAWLRTWFLDPATGMNPNLEFAQSIPFSGKGNPWGIIDANAFPRMLDSVGLLADSGLWTEADETALRAWFTRFNTWLSESELGRKEALAKNNHGTFYDLLLATGASYAGDDALARRVLAAVGPVRYDRQIQADGSTPEELRRVESAMYTCWNLTGLLDLAVLAEKHGMHLWKHPANAEPALLRAGHYLVPYVAGEKPWTHGKQELKPWSPLAFFWRASLRYDDPRIVGALERHILTEARREQWEADPINLLWPRAARTAPAINASAPGDSAR